MPTSRIDAQAALDYLIQELPGIERARGVVPADSFNKLRDLLECTIWAVEVAWTITEIQNARRAELPITMRLNAVEAKWRADWPTLPYPLIQARSYARLQGPFLHLDGEHICAVYGAYIPLAALNEEQLKQIGKPTTLGENSPVWRTTIIHLAGQPVVGIVTHDWRDTGPWRKWDGNPSMTDYGPALEYADLQLRELEKGITMMPYTQQEPGRDVKRGLWAVRLYWDAAVLAQCAGHADERGHMDFPRLPFDSMWLKFKLDFSDPKYAPVREHGVYRQHLAAQGDQIMAVYMTWIPVGLADDLLVSR